MTDNLAEFLEALRVTRFVGEPDEALVDATNKYITSRESDEIAPELVDGLKTLPIFGASWLAILLGSSVEGGSDPMKTGPAMWEAFCDRMHAFPETVEVGDSEECELHGVAGVAGVAGHAGLARAHRSPRRNFGSLSGILPGVSCASNSHA